MNKILEAKAIQKSFQDGSGKQIDILKGIDLEVFYQDTISIMGQSGTGKSTLMHILGGLDTATAGEVICEQENIHQKNSDELADWRNQKLGFVFQAHHLLNDFSALENVSIPYMIQTNNKKTALLKAEEILTKLDLKERIHHQVVNLSGGEQQRVSIARALINSPRFILADEPTGNLDEKTGLIVAETMKEVCFQEQAALIVVTHNSYFASKMEKRFLLLNGKLQLQR